MAAASPVLHHRARATFAARAKSTTVTTTLDVRLAPVPRRQPPGTRAPIPRRALAARVARLGSARLLLSQEAVKGAGGLLHAVQSPCPLLLMASCDATPVAPAYTASGDDNGELWLHAMEALLRAVNENFGPDQYSKNIVD